MSPQGYDFRVLSLGAGVQSSTVLEMALAGEFHAPPTVAIFADTGWEPKAVYAYLENLERRSWIPIIRVSAGNLRRDVLAALETEKVGHIGQPPFFVRNGENDGTPSQGRGGMLWRKCTTEYKIEPIHKRLRELLGYKPHQRVKSRVQQWFGISLDEGHRQRDSRVPWIDNFYPLIERRMTRQDCVTWLTKRGLPIPEKSACLGCPFHRDTYWIKLRHEHPDEWDDVVEFDAKLRKGKLPGVKGDAYLHRAMLPLPEAVEKSLDPNQIDLFGNECEGMCGV